MERDEPPEDRKVSPGEIWDDLTPEQRRPVIRLLVQMALEVVQSERAKEDDRPYGPTQGEGKSDESIDRSD